MYVYPDAVAMARAAAEKIACCCAAAIRDKDTFYVALSGGNTPVRCYELLRSMQMDWRHVHVYFRDERCLPRGDAERNDTMACQTLLKHVSIPSGHIHSIPAELGPEDGATAYAEILTRIPALALVLLGIGEDGHTASLFPCHPALTDNRLAIPVHAAPKPPPERVTMGYSMLNGARLRMVMAAGAGKHEVIRRIRRGEDLPAARLASSAWYVDTEAVRKDE